MNEGRLYTIKELCSDEIGYKESYLRQLVRSDDLWQFGHKEGRTYKINKAELEKYLKKQTKMYCRMRL